MVVSPDAVFASAAFLKVATCPTVVVIVFPKYMFSSLKFLMVAFSKVLNNGPFKL